MGRLPSICMLYRESEQASLRHPQANILSVLAGRIILRAEGAQVEAVVLGNMHEVN